MKYDIDNRILTIEELSQCDFRIIADWIHDHVEDVLESKPTKSYRTNKWHTEISVVYKKYIVGIYDFVYGGQDDFFPQTIAYYTALNET
jgi:hypothetical protein